MSARPCPRYRRHGRRNEHAEEGREWGSISARPLPGRHEEERQQHDRGHRLERGGELGATADTRSAKAKARAYP
jgi:hypothetical protein